MKEVDHIKPKHYQNNSKEVFEMMIDIWGREDFIKHCEMTAFKYRMRVGLKPDQPIERDLEKAKWYENKAKELTETERGQGGYGSTGKLIILTPKNK